MADEADSSAVQLVQTLSADHSITGSTATAEFEDLCVWDEAQETPIPVVEGHWKFRFDVDYEDASVTLGGGETFTQNGMTFTVDAVTVNNSTCSPGTQLESRCIPRFYRRFRNYSRFYNRCFSGWKNPPRPVCYPSILRLQHGRLLPALD